MLMPMPAAIPTITGRIVSPSSRRIRPAPVAPSAERMPSSRVRKVAIASPSTNTLSAVSSSAITPSPPSTAEPRRCGDIWRAMASRRVRTTGGTAAGSRSRTASAIARATGSTPRGGPHRQRPVGLRRIARQRHVERQRLQLAHVGDHVGHDAHHGGHRDRRTRVAAPRQLDPASQRAGLRAQLPRHRGTDDGDERPGVVGWNEAAARGHRQPHRVQVVRVHRHRANVGRERLGVPSTSRRPAGPIPPAPTLDATAAIDGCALRRACTSAKAAAARTGS